MGSTSRVLVAELDSPAQAARFSVRGSSVAITEITGMLRVGMLVSRRILVTDAMLLDGAYFMTLGPEGVLRELGAAPAQYPLTITGRHATLREGLQARLDDKSFRWSLATRDRGLPETAQKTWAEWLHFVDAGLIDYEQQMNAVAPLRTGAPPTSDEAEFAVVMAAGLSEQKVRSVAWGMIDELSVDDHYRVRIREWWDEAYLRMIAENARADWVSFETSSKLGRNHHELPLPEELVAWARASTPATIAVAWDATEPQRERLHARPTWARVRDLAFGATRVSVAPSRRGVLSGSILKLLLAVVVLALAAPWLSIGSLDNPWTWVAFVGAIATTVPFDSLGALLGLLKTAPRTRIVLYREELS
jgi:hypothetical protein